MKRYRGVTENKEYSEEILKHIFQFIKHNGFTGTFEEWITEEISKGYLKLIEHKTELEQANDNILQLIDIIISYETSSLGPNCPRTKTKRIHSCPTDVFNNRISCEECKEIYLNTLRQKLENKYLIKDE